MYFVRHDGIVPFVSMVYLQGPIRKPVSEKAASRSTARALQ